MFFCKIFLVFFMSFSFLINNSFANVNDHAPIGVMGDHMHKKGEWMTSYRYMDMTMEDLYIDDSEVALGDISGYMMKPTEMTMKMHMFGLMYAPSDDLTLMIMTNYIENDMTMINNSGVYSDMESNGISDLKLTSIRDISNKGYLKGQTLMQVGLSLPTGSIDEEESGTRLPYKMQLGSGTIDPIIAIINRQNIGELTLGTQVAATLRFGHNDEGYRLGDEYKVNLWLDKNINHNFSVSARLNFTSITKYDGSDSEISSGMSSPTRDSELQNGDLIDFAFGFNYRPSHDANYGFGFEYNIPIYQNLNGPQLGKSGSFTLGSFCVF